ncbi:hypothetical protein ANCCAN_01292, partial [Ancylostoma caninum]
ARPRFDFTSIERNSSLQNSRRPSSLSNTCLEDIQQRVDHASARVCVRNRRKSSEES